MLHGRKVFLTAFSKFQISKLFTNSFMCQSVIGPARWFEMAALLRQSNKALKLLAIYPNKPLLAVQIKSFQPFF